MKGKRAGSERVIVFDTTLRDGEQSPGGSLASAEKLEVARQLARLRVDVIEAGFPAASPDDFEAVRAIAASVGQQGGPTIAALARAHRDDIDAAWRALEPAASPRIHTFIATSDLHIERKLRTTRAAVLKRVSEMVAYARNLGPEVEFSPEDASRSEIDFLVEVLARAIASGATTLNIPDTVGYATPAEYGALIGTLIARTPGADRVVWSTHCHDDLGLATANTVSGVLAGARQVEVTVNGIGERAGNASLEEVVMALDTRPDVFGVSTGVDTTQLARASHLVASFTGIGVPPNKAVVGANAFAHEAGIHQDGVLKDQRTYEIMTPEKVGVRRSTLVLGKHSGRHALRARLSELGFELDDAQVGAAFRAVKALADRKKVVTDADLEAIVADELFRPVETFRLVDLQVTCGRPGMSTATVRIAGPDDELRAAAALGAGPVDATFRAIDVITGGAASLAEFSVRSITEGIDALGEVTVRVAGGERSSVVSGHGADTDIIVASAKAYLGAINRLAARLGERKEPSPALAAMGGDAEESR